MTANRPNSSSLFFRTPFPGRVKTRLLLVLATGFVFLNVGRTVHAENLLRNGSFEGGMLYWHNLSRDDYTLVRGGAPVGEYALCIKNGFAMSAPFVARRGEPFTVSFFIRGDTPGIVDVSMPPSAREVGQKAGRLWVRGAGQTARIGTEWRRVSFTWSADVPQDGFWPNPHYLVQIGGGATTLPIYVDGVTVTSGRDGTPAYVPRREVEIVAECPDLPGYSGARANLFERGATPRVTAHVSNPGEANRTVTVRWQFVDYEGEQAVSEPIEKKLTLAPGQTRSETVPMELTSVGMVLARVSVFSDLDPRISNATTPIDSSDIPLSSLPYPKSATKPDWRERFGGSFAGGTGCVQKFQRLGFGWIRWRPHANGEDHLPKEPADKGDSSSWEWTWFDRELDEQEAHGCSSHLVLYPPPKWVMEKGNPLPRDMRWPATDPRWDDPSIETVWDKFVKAAVARYRGRSVVYEIENEPAFDHWDDRKEQYVRFTIRTARLIKRIDPGAKVMVDNVYGIPSSVNAAFFKAGGLKFIDVMSWHDYHEGWLTDATGIRRMRQNLDEHGGKHVEIWFNEGWAYSNTAVDEPIACTSLTSAQSANAIVACVAELTANGQDKTILFHTAYETHGMSFWDYSGPGTMLWDWYDYPLPIAPAWNVLVHHIGVSECAGFIRPTGANFCVFQDQRNNRGVMIAYADRESKSDATVMLPEFGVPLTAEDMMGNSSAAPRKLVLSKTGRPVILYAANGSCTGEDFAVRLEPLDRKYASFVRTGSSAPSWSLPPAWEGPVKGSSDGSVAMADGRPVWKLEQIWPPDPGKPGNYRPMVWTGTDWNVKDGGFGGQPGARLDGRALNLATRAPHGDPPQWRVAVLTFVAPQSGAYSLSGTAECRIWDGQNQTTLRLFHKKADVATEVGNVAIPPGGKAPLDSLRITLAAGEEFALVPQIEGAWSGGDCKLRELRVTLGDQASNGSGGGLIFKLPAAWEGVKKGGTEGNPALADGKPIWRIDRVYPSEHTYVGNYAPVPWDGTSWHPEDHQQGGQPRVRIESGKIRIEVAGPWQNAEFQKIAGLVFIAPRSGLYRVRAAASTKPWTGGAKAFRLVVLKKDTQRAAEMQSFLLPGDGASVSLDFRVELTSGHELVFLPLMPDWNNATTTTLEGLAIEHTP